MMMTMCLSMTPSGPAWNHHLLASFANGILLRFLAFCMPFVVMSKRKLKAEILDGHAIEDGVAQVE